MKINWWIVWGLTNIFLIIFGLVGYLNIHPITIEVDDFFALTFWGGLLSSFFELMLFTVPVGY